jgi:hypothetical protein
VKEECVSLDAPLVVVKLYTAAATTTTATAITTKHEPNKGIQTHIITSLLNEIPKRIGNTFEASNISNSTTTTTTVTATFSKETKWTEKINLVVGSGLGYAVVFEYVLHSFENRIASYRIESNRIESRQEKSNRIEF